MAKSIRLHHYVLLLAFFIQTMALGQIKESFEKGMIELRSGQKLEGFIKNDDLSKMVYKIAYKHEATDKKATSYDTSQVNAFSFGAGNVFELLHLRINNGTKSLTVFSRLLLRGKASLYKTVYGNDELYVVKNDNNYFVLQNDKLDPGGVSREVSRFYFKDYLMKALGGSFPPNINPDRIDFWEKDFVRVITEYNSSTGSPTELLLMKKNQRVHFFIVGIGGMLKSSSEAEYFFQGTYRTYFTSTSKSTSLNIGLNYYGYKYPETTGGVNHKYTSRLISVPGQVQQNFLNKNIRPFVFAGFCISYYTVKNENGISQIEKGFQSNFGLGLLFGGGVEVDIYKGLMLKAEYRYEIYSHPVLIGVGFHF